MNKFSIKAVAIGGVVAALLTFVCRLAIRIVVFGLVHLHHPGAGQGRAIREAGHNLFWYDVLVGCLCTLFGGYLAGRIAKSDKALHGAASSWLCVLYPLILQIWSYTHVIKGYETTAIWLAPLLMVAYIVSALAGGYLATVSVQPRT